jgi:hypothetical protein
MSDWGQGSQLVEALAAYRAARLAFLEAIGCRADSMRDPLSEFAELLVAVLTGDRLADSPVQKGWDLISPEGRTTQVRYVANPRGKWVNGHEVKFVAGVDRYALVLYESLESMRVSVSSGSRCTPRLAIMRAERASGNHSRNSRRMPPARSNRSSTRTARSMTTGASSIATMKGTKRRAVDQRRQQLFGSAVDVEAVLDLVAIPPVAREGRV